MSPIMTSDSSPESASELSTDMPMNNAPGGEMSALARVLSQPPQTTPTASLLSAVKARGEDIRAYIDAGGSWDDLVPALEEDLKQRVSRKTLETYVARYHPRRPKASHGVKLITPDFKIVPAGSPSMSRQSATPIPSNGAPQPAPVSEATTSPKIQKSTQGVNKFVGPR